MSEVWLNDVDLTDYTFALGQNPGHASSPDFSDATSPLIGQIGPIWLGEPAQSPARRLSVAGSILQTSAAAFRATVDSLKQLASNGAIRLRFADRSDQEFRDCRLMTFSPSPRAAILGNVAGDIAMSFEVANPVRFDVNPQGIALSPARAQLPIGTAPTFPLIVIHGGGATLSAITMTMRNASGDSVQTMGFTGSLGANDFLLVDCDRIEIRLSTAGVLTDATSWWTSGDFPVIRAADGWPDISQYPTLELAGTGTPVGLCTYARRWL